VNSPTLPWVEGHGGPPSIDEEWLPLVTELADTLAANHPGYKFTEIYEKDGQLRAHIVMPGGKPVPDDAYAAIWDMQIKSTRPRPEHWQPRTDTKEQK
jgi:hypothetical protein